MREGDGTMLEYMLAFELAALVTAGFYGYLRFARKHYAGGEER